MPVAFIDLPKGLYELSPENKRFVGARYSIANAKSLDAYKREIAVFVSSKYFMLIEGWALLMVGLPTFGHKVF